jgi:low temperature requirement protein LtrA
MTEHPSEADRREDQLAPAGSAGGTEWAVASAQAKQELAAPVDRAADHAHPEPADSDHHADHAHPEPADSGARATSDPTIRVTAIELFFDLIFAFTLTQLTVLLSPGNGTPTVNVLRVILIFGLLWWMYGGYAWLTNARPPVSTVERLLLILGMAGFLISGLAIPRGFSGDGVAIGLGYLLLVCVHTALYQRVNRNILRVAPFNLLSALLVVAARFTSGVADYLLWLAALAVQALAPLFVRVSGRFDIRPAHFAERHGALVIVAIGESVAAIGIGAGRSAVDANLVVAAAGLAMSAVLWWAYFGNCDDERGQHAMTAARREQRPNLALSAYFYAHIPVLLGIVFIAAGVREEIEHGGSADLAAALALGAGGAAFIGGTAAFRAALRSGPTATRLMGAAFALVTVPIGAAVSIEAQLVVLAAGLALMLALDRREASAQEVEA